VYISPITNGREDRWGVRMVASAGINLQAKSESKHMACDIENG
jgi:hypothetical protein